MEIDMKDVEHYFASLNAKYIFWDFSKIFESTNITNRVLEEHNLVKAIKSVLVNDIDNYTIVLNPADKQDFYRARRIKNPIDQIRITDDSYLNGFDKYDSKEPPLGKSPDGRNNIGGATYLYLAEDVYTACAEVRPLAYEMISVARFQIKKELTIIDLTKPNASNRIISLNNTPIDISEMMTYVAQKYATPAYNSTDYLATQYLSDYIRKFGYDGIKYKSSMSFGNNLTVFNSCEENIEFCGSTVIRCQKEKFDFYDLNSFNKIEPPARLSSLELSNEELSIIKDIIIKNINNGGQN